MDPSLDKQIRAIYEHRHRPLTLNSQHYQICLHELSLILTVSHRYLDDKFFTANVLKELHLTRR